MVHNDDNVMNKWSAVAVIDHVFALSAAIDALLGLELCAVTFTLAALYQHFIFIMLFLSCAVALIVLFMQNVT